MTTYVKYLYEKVGGDASGLAAATAKLAFANTPLGFTRTAVAIASCGSADIYVKQVPAGAAAPTVTATDHLLKIPSGQTAVLRAGQAIDIYIFGTSEYYAQELQ